MAQYHSSLFVTAATLVLIAGAAAAQEAGDWKKGRIYYRAVCTSCHEANAGGAISPASKTIAEWKAYLGSDKGGQHVGTYVAQAYRQKVAPENKVAKAFAKIPDADMLADLRAFVIHGAKDSATPATCN